MKLFIISTNASNLLAVRDEDVLYVYDERTYPFEDEPDFVLTDMNVLNKAIENFKNDELELDSFEKLSMDDLGNLEETNEGDGVKWFTTEEWISHIEEGSYG